MRRNLGGPRDIHCTWAPREEDIARESERLVYRSGSIGSWALALCDPTKLEHYFEIFKGPPSPRTQFQKTNQRNSISTALLINDKRLRVHLRAFKILGIPLFTPRHKAQISRYPRPPLFQLRRYPIKIHTKAMSDKTAYVDLSQEAIDAFNAAFNPPGQQGNTESSSSTRTSLEEYKEQPPDADGAPYFGRYQAEKPRR